MKHCSYCHLEYDPTMLLYPKTCPQCGAEDGQDEVIKQEQFFCPNCLRTVPQTDEVVTAEEWTEAQAFQARMIAARRGSERNE